jgi:putative hydrolase of the HAD superfamily
MNHIKHVFFDLDHTLWDFDKNSKLTFIYIFEKHQLNIDIEKFLEGYEVINFKFWKLYREDKINKEYLRFNRLKEALDLIGYKASDQLIHLLSEDYIKYLTNYNFLFDGTLDVLEYLHPKYQLHILTNGFTEVQSLKMNKSGLSNFFTTITDAEMAGVKKPNPDIFNFALNQAQAQTSNSIMIGDSFEADILGANNIGLDAIFFNPKNKETQKGFKAINHLSLIKTFL